MGIFAIILAIAFFVVLFICMNKEKELVGIYKATKTFGRFYAFLAVDLLFGGICAPIASIVLMLTSEENGAMSVPVVLGIVAAGVVLAALGVLMYKHAYKKCPDALKSRCYKDLTIIGFGVIIRFSLFFMMFIFKAWWEFNKPTEYVLADGTRVYAYNDGTVYDMHGRKGKLAEIDGRDNVVWD